MTTKADSIEHLAKIFKLDKEFVNIPAEYAKAKMAEAMTGKNTMQFFMDTFGYKVRFDKHSFNCDETPNENYCHKILYDFKKQYHEAVENGFGANKMDSLEKIFKARGLDKDHPVLYGMIVKYRDFLNEKTLTANTESAAEELARRGKTKNKLLLPFLAAGAVIIGGGAYYYARKHPATQKNNTQPQKPSERPSLVKIA